MRRCAPTGPVSCHARVGRDARAPTADTALTPDLPPSLPTPAMPRCKRKATPSPLGSDDDAHHCGDLLGLQVGLAAPVQPPAAASGAHRAGASAAAATAGGGMAPTASLSNNSGGTVVSGAAGTSGTTEEGRAAQTADVADVMRLDSSNPFMMVPVPGAAVDAAGGARRAVAGGGGGGAAKRSRYLVAGARHAAYAHASALYCVGGDDSEEQRSPTNANGWHGRPGDGLASPSEGLHTGGGGYSGIATGGGTAGAFANFPPPPGAAGVDATMSVLPAAFQAAWATGAALGAGSPRAAAGVPGVVFGSPRSLALGGLPGIIKQPSGAHANVIKGNALASPVGGGTTNGNPTKARRGGSPSDSHGTNGSSAAAGVIAKGKGKKAQKKLCGGAVNGARGRQAKQPGRGGKRSTDYDAVSSPAGAHRRAKHPIDADGHAEDPTDGAEEWELAVSNGAGEEGGAGAGAEAGGREGKKAHGKRSKAAKAAGQHDALAQRLEQPQPQRPRPAHLRQHVPMRKRSLAEADLDDDSDYEYASSDSDDDDGGSKRGRRGSSSKRKRRRSSVALGSPRSAFAPPGAGAGGGRGGSKDPDTRIFQSRHWTSEDDELCKKLVAKYGTGKWVAVSKEMGKRPKQIHARWRDYLRPGIVGGPFTDDEVQLLARMHAKHGNDWSGLAKLVKGRSANALKNRVNAARRLVRKVPLKEGGAAVKLWAHLYDELD